MTLKIERYADGHHTTLRLIGYLQAEYLEELQAQIEHNGPRMALDLDEVTLVDVEVVRFLGVCEAEGIALLHCSPYKQNLQSSRQNSRPSKQIDRSFLSLGSNSFRLKLCRCCLYTRVDRQRATQGRIRSHRVSPWPGSYRRGDSDEAEKHNGAAHWRKQRTWSFVSNSGAFDRD